MEIENPEYIPDPSLSKGEMKSLQRRISETAVFEDRLDTDFQSENYLIAGVDQAFANKEAVSVVVVIQGDEVVERTHSVTEVGTPYIPGFLSFREGKPIVAALTELETEPDVVVFDGSGRIHYRQAGLATHIGVLFDKPAIGVIKSLLCGNTVRSFGRLKEGECVEVVAGEKVEAESETKIGYAYQSKQYSRESETTVNPLYVSPGHRMCAETAVGIVDERCDRYKLPEPIRRADSLAGELKQGLV